MNGQPHVHDIKIHWCGGDAYWTIEYGDQRQHVEIPQYESPRAALEAGVRKIIQDHDNASRAAGERQTVIPVVLAQFAHLQPDRWGSDQFDDVHEQDWRELPTRVLERLPVPR